MIYGGRCGISEFVFLYRKCWVEPYISVWSLSHNLIGQIAEPLSELDASFYKLCGLLAKIKCSLSYYQFSGTERRRPLVQEGVGVSLVSIY